MALSWRICLIWGQFSGNLLAVLKNSISKVSCDPLVLFCLLGRLGQQNTRSDHVLYALNIIIGLTTLNRVLDWATTRSVVIRIMALFEIHNFNYICRLAMNCQSSSINANIYVLLKTLNASIYQAFAFKRDFT